MQNYRTNSGRKSVDFSRSLSQLIIRSIRLHLFAIQNIQKYQATSFVASFFVRWIKCLWNNAHTMKKNYNNNNGSQERIIIIIIRRRWRITIVKTWIIRKGLRNKYVCIRAEEMLIVFSVSYSCFDKVEPKWASKFMTRWDDDQFSVNLNVTTKIIDQTISTFHIHTVR